MIIINWFVSWRLARLNGARTSVATKKRGKREFLDKVSDAEQECFEVIILIMLRRNFEARQ